MTESHSGIRVSELKPERAENIQKGTIFKLLVCPRITKRQWLSLRYIESIGTSSSVRSREQFGDSSPLISVPLLLNSTSKPEPDSPFAYTLEILHKCQRRDYIPSEQLAYQQNCYELSPSMLSNTKPKNLLRILPKHSPNNSYTHPISGSLKIQLYHKIFKNKHIQNGHRNFSVG